MEMNDIERFVISETQGFLRIQLFNRYGLLNGPDHAVVVQEYQSAGHGFNSCSGHFHSHKLS